MRVKCSIYLEKEDDGDSEDCGTLVDILSVSIYFSLLPPSYTEMVKRPLEAETPSFHPSKLDPSDHLSFALRLTKNVSCSHHAVYKTSIINFIRC